MISPSVIAAASRRQALSRWNLPATTHFISHRKFATSRQKRAAAAKEKKDGQPSSSSSSSASIIGMRPGQTPFSPPTKQSPSSPSSKFASKTNDGSNSLEKNYTNSSNAKTANKPPLILPPTPDQFPPADESRRDNSLRAHSRPFDALSPPSDNPARDLFLRRGVLPPPPRPAKRPAGDDVPSKPVEMPPPHPSGVSNADPEDVIDMASMYDPSIHLPDKPDFASASNRARYEPGTPLTDELIAYVGVRGPITVAEFMRRALRDGRWGYYTRKGARGGRKANYGGDGTVSVADENDWDLDDDIPPSDADRSDVGGERIIGSGGDFVTAPEVSQLFGEMILVWLMTQYQTLGKPSKIQLIEIGPGKGTLICDVLRSAISTFGDFASALTAVGSSGRKVDVGVHLIEVTNGMRARQRESLQNLEKEKVVKEKSYSFHFAGDGDDNTTAVCTENSDDATLSTKQNSNHTISVEWHDVLSSVPTHDTDGNPIPTFIICQELVDALPIHSFQKIEGGVWRERLIDCAIRDDAEASAEANNVRMAVARKYSSAEDPSATASASTSSPATPEGAKKLPRLRFVLPPDTTPALRTLLRVDGNGSPLQDNHASQSLDSLPVGSIIEACPEGLVLVQDIASRIEKCRGAALVIDYGEDGAVGDTLRGFWRHSQVHPLSRPGEVDVTADVDFGALREAVNRRVSLEESLERKRGKRDRDGSGKEAELVSELKDKLGENQTKSKTIKPEAFGPISQGEFLASMGIVERVERYIENDATTDDQADELCSALERLVSADQMGERYKVLAIAPKKDGLFPPPGF